MTTNAEPYQRRLDALGRDRDRFLRELLRELAGTLEEVVGVEEAEGYVSVVGGRIGDLMDREYREAFDADKLDLEQVSKALVDLKARIQGGFRIESVDGTAIVLVNSACPFGRYVEGRESLCMMTSNVFGRIAAQNLGYAGVSLERTIARGDGECRVVVHLVPPLASTRGQLREYFPVGE